jgi:hypothetical protein
LAAEGERSTKCALTSEVEAVGVVAFEGLEVVDTVGVAAIFGPQAASSRAARRIILFMRV